MAVVSSFAIVYLVILALLATPARRNRHNALFWIGFILPVLWLVGPIMKPSSGNR